IELADAPSVREMDAVEAAVGNRPSVRDRELAGPGTASHRPLCRVPDDPRPKLREALGRVAAVEHVENVLQLLSRDLGEGLRGAEQSLPLSVLPLRGRA